jgi:hypothetical protein
MIHRSGPPRRSAPALLLALAALLASCGRDPVAPPAPPPEAPRIRDFRPGAGAWVTGPVELELLAPGADSATIEAPGLARTLHGPSPFRVPWDSRLSPNGAQTLRGRAWNAGGAHDTTIVLFADNVEQPPVFVVEPADPEVVVGEVATFSVELFGLPDRRIRWTLHPAPGSDPGEAEDIGTLSSDGRYTAPLVPPKAGAVVIRASAMAKPGTSVDIPVRITGVGVRVTPGAGRVNGTDALALAAQVVGSQNGQVTWSIDEGDAHGAVTPDGVFTGPATLPEPPRATVRATSVADPARSAAAIVTLYPPVQVVAEADSIELQLGQSRNFTAVVHHATGLDVTWSLLEAAGTYGSLSGSGRYTAPAILPLPSIARLVARSGADPRAADTIRVLLRQPPNPPPPPPPPPTDTLGVALVELSGAAVRAIRLVDEAIDLVSRTAALAPRDSTGQPILFGTVRKTPEGNYYGPAPRTFFRVIEENRPTIELFTNEFLVVHWGRLSQPWPNANTGFIGRFAGRIVVDGQLDLEMEVVSTSQGIFGFEIRSWLSGTGQGATPFRANVTRRTRGTIRAHSEVREEHVQGTLGIGPGRGSFSIDDSILWQRANDCHAAGGSSSSTWQWRARTTGTVLGSVSTFQADAEGRRGSPCAQYYTWGTGTVSGHLLRDAHPVGYLESGLRSDGNGTPVQVRFASRLYPVILPYLQPPTADLIPW